jgi:hypothetical protein
MFRFRMEDSSNRKSENIIIMQFWDSFVKRTKLYYRLSRHDHDLETSEEVRLAIEGGGNHLNSPILFSKAANKKTL